MENTSLILNPRYISSGFGSQASNIRKYEPLSVRKIACFMKTVASFIRKHNSGCYASTETLLDEYNKNSSKYGVKPIAKRTLGNLQAKAEDLGLIQVSTVFDKKKGIKRRLINFVFTGIEKGFKAVYKWALKAANNFCGIGDLHDGGSTCEEPQEIRDYKASQQIQDEQNYTTRSKILSNDRKNKNNGSRRLSYDDFLIKYFGADANEVKSLQQSARYSQHSENPITASGAKRLIELHNQHGYPLAPSFAKFLNHIIAKEHHRNQWLRNVTISAYKVGDMTDEEAIQAANHELAYWETTFVERGLSEIVVDKATGVARVRHLSDKEIQRNAAIQQQQQQAFIPVESNTSPFRDVFSEVFGIGKQEPKPIASGRNVFERISNTWGE